MNSSEAGERLPLPPCCLFAFSKILLANRAFLVGSSSVFGFVVLVLQCNKASLFQKMKNKKSDEQFRKSQPWNCGSISRPQ
jgi:hypothetical protein